MSESMKVQYQILSELRKIDEKVARLRKELERIPAESAKIREAIESRQTEYLKIKELTEAAEKKLRKAEMDLREREDHLKKAESKMMEVKTNEEYQAALKENESQKGEKSKVEEVILAMMNELEAQKTQLKTVEQTFQSYEATLKKDLDQLTTDEATAKKLLEEQLAERLKTAGSLAPETKAVYIKIAERFKGITIVTAQNERCLGCNMKIRPQIYNEVLGLKAIHPCPNCGRIIVVENRTDETTVVTTA